MFSNPIRKDNFGYLFIAPFLILFLLFHIYPILYSFYLSFTNSDGLNTPQFIGIANYTRAFTDTVFYQSVLNTFIIWIPAVIPQLVVGLVLAVILNEKFLKGKSFFRAVFFFPNIVTAASIGLLVNLMFDWQSGSVNHMLMSFGIIRDPIDWTDNSTFMRLLISAILFFQFFGYSMLLYIAGLQGISTDYSEAAQLDGASKVQIFFQITIPLLRPIIIFQIIISLIGGVQIFDQPYTLTNGSGGPDNATLTGVMYLYNIAFQQNNFGYGAAIAFCLFIIIFILSVTSFRLMNGKSEKVMR